MANLYPAGAQELSVAEDATRFFMAGILLEAADVIPTAIPTAIRLALPGRARRSRIPPAGGSGVSPTSG
jgi:hypothetical protein